MFSGLKSMVTSSTGPGALLGMAAKFGVLSPGLSLIVGGLRRAPAPQQTTLGGDWLKNVDVMSHGVGCMVCGIFDNIVEGLTPEELAAVQPEDVAGLLENVPPWLESLVITSFGVCRETYLEFGDLTDAVEAKKFDPAGIVIKAGVMPLLQKKQAAKGDGKHPLLRRKPSTGSESSPGVIEL